MDHIALFHSRQVWSALLQSGAPIGASTWRDWADSRIGALSVPPLWVLELAVAGDRSAALTSVLSGIGDESSWTDSQALSREALLIGFIYGRYASHDISLAEMWDLLNANVDIAEFMDGEKWRSFVPSDVTIEWADPEKAMEDTLAAIARFARKRASELDVADLG